MAFTTMHRARLENSADVVQESGSLSAVSHPLHGWAAGRCGAQRVRPASTGAGARCGRIRQRIGGGRRQTPGQVRASAAAADQARRIAERRGRSGRACHRTEPVGQHGRIAPSAASCVALLPVRARAVGPSDSTPPLRSTPRYVAPTDGTRESLHPTDRQRAAWPPFPLGARPLTHIAQEWFPHARLPRRRRPCTPPRVHPEATRCVAYSGRRGAGPSQV